jgi:hypothetical protein
MIENRPLSSVVAVKLLGDALGIFGGDRRALDRLTGFVFHDAADAAGLGRGAAGQRCQTGRNQHASDGMKTVTHARNPLKNQYILNRVKARFAPLALAAVVSSAQAPAPRVESTAGFSPIAPLVEAAIARHDLPGAVVLVGRGDTVVYRRAFGQRAVAPAAEAMTEDTIFDLASLTKVVATTTSVMKLMEEGRIRLNDPVAAFIPEFGKYGKAGITIRHC